MKSRISTILFAAILIINCIALSQTPYNHKDWVAAFDGTASGNDLVSSMAIDNNNNIYVAGTAFIAASNTDIVLIKYDPAGNELWKKNFNRAMTGNDGANDVICDNEGNVYVAGYVQGTSQDIIVLKYSSNGDWLWSSQFNGFGSGIDIANKLAIDDNGHIYVIGEALKSVSDFITLKLDPTNGNILWHKYYNNYYDTGTNIVFSKGFIYVTGYSHNYLNNDIVTIKYKLNGDEIWTKRYNNSGADVPYSMTADKSGNVFVTGTSQSTTNGYDIVILKYTPTGNLNTVRYETSGTDAGNKILTDSKGNVYVTGYITHPGTPTNDDYITLKYDNNLYFIWERFYSGEITGSDKAVSMAVDKFENVYVTGISRDPIPTHTNYDIVTLKYDKLGNPLWADRYNRAANYVDRSVDIKIDGQLFPIVIGNSNSGSNAHDFVTMKYFNCDKVLICHNGQELCIDAISLQDHLSHGDYLGSCQEGSNMPNIVNNEFKLFDNYPNPFNPLTTIKFSIPEAQRVKLAIYDLQGREVAVLADETLNGGNHAYDWLASNYPSGVYFYILTAGDKKFTKKMILIK